MALLARLAGIPHVAATSEDYPGSLLDVRHRRVRRRRPRGRRRARGRGHVRARRGGGPPAGRRTGSPPRPLPAATGRPGPGRYVVVHPGASRARPRASRPARRGRASPRRSPRDGWHVVVTGGPGERARRARRSRRGTASTWPAAPTSPSSPACSPAPRASSSATPGRRTCRGRRHARGQSLFSPVVPAERWRPVRVPTVVLGDQERAPAGGTRARACPVAGHPCPTAVTGREVVDAVRALARRRSAEHWDGVGVRILVWHVHGSWTDLVRPGRARLPPAGPARPRPRRPGPGPDLGLAGAVREVTPRSCATRRSTSSCCSGRTRSTWSSAGPAAGRDRRARACTSSTTPPPGTPCAASTRPCATTGCATCRSSTSRAFNAMAWDCGGRPTTVIEHGIPDPGHRYTGDRRLAGGGRQRAGAPVAGRRHATSLLDMARSVPVSTSTASAWTGSARSRSSARSRAWTAAGATTSPQHQLHDALARHRAYFHPYRWTSLGPVADRGDDDRHAGAGPARTTEAPEAVPAAARAGHHRPRLGSARPPGAGSPTRTRRAARGEVARPHALDRFWLTRFLDRLGPASSKEVAR